MCRMVGWVAPEPVTLRELLGDDAVERLRALATVHCHGWGVAWTDGSGTTLQRSARSAADDPGFLAAADGLAATAAVVHLRMGTPGFGRTVVDNHPFADESWAMIHNGAVAPPDRVDRLLRADSARRPAGSTDSERWFLALRDEIDAGADLPAAVQTVVGRAMDAGLHASSWNSMLLGPDALHVINHHDLALLPNDIKLWPELHPGLAISWPPYFDLRMRQREGTSVVLSSGVVDDVDGWTLLPNTSVLRLALDSADWEITELDESSLVTS
jgi:predicted glutamine amidotransferase